MAKFLYETSKGVTPKFYHEITIFICNFRNFLNSEQEEDIIEMMSSSLYSFNTALIPGITEKTEVEYPTNITFELLDKFVFNYLPGKSCLVNMDLAAELAIHFYMWLLHFNLVF